MAAVGRRSHRTARKNFSGRPWLVVLPALAGLALALVPGAAQAAQSPDTIDQHWELLSENITYNAVTNGGQNVYWLSRQAFPRTGFDPTPNAKLVVVAKVTGATAGSWTVNLMSDDEYTTAFPDYPITIPASSSTNPTVFTSTITWPTTDKNMNFLLISPVSYQSGTLTILKAYLDFQQTGVIKKTIGRVPMGTRQSQIISTSGQDIQDPYLFTYHAADFSPAPSDISWRATANVSACQLTLELHDVTAETQGRATQIATLHFYPASVPQEQYETGLALTDGDQYKVRAWISTSCFGGGNSAQSAQTQSGVSPTGDFLSSDLQFTQSTTDPLGLTQTVGWYPSVSAATDVTSSSALGYLIEAPAAVVPKQVVPSYSETLRTNGTGSIASSLYDGGTPTFSGTNTGATTYVEFSVQMNSLASLPRAGDTLDTRATLTGTGTTGRVSATLMKYVLSLRDTDGPVLGTLTQTISNLDPANFGASTKAISPNGDNKQDSVTYSSTLKDFSPATWFVKIWGTNGAGTRVGIDPVRTYSGTTTPPADWANHPLAINSPAWDGTNDANAPVDDGIYDAELSAVDGAGNSSLLQDVFTTVDRVAPAITNAVSSQARIAPLAGPPNVTTYTAGISEPSAWTLAMSGPGSTSFSGSTTGINQTVSQDWSGRYCPTCGAFPDGTYTGTFSAVDVAGNRGLAIATPNLVLDSTAPTISGVTPSTSSFFSPVSGNTINLSSSLADQWSPISWTLAIQASDGNVVRSVDGTGSSVTFCWDGSSNRVCGGSDTSGALVADGTYTPRLTVKDGGGNVLTTSLPQIVLDDSAPRIDPFQTLPGDGTETVYGNQRLVTSVSDAGGSTLNSSTISITLQDVTAGTSTTYSGASIVFTPSTGIAKTASSVSLIVGHRYRISVSARDRAGNQGTLTQSSDPQGGFLAISRTLNATQAQIPPTQCTLTASGTPGIDNATCTDVRVNFDASQVTLSSANHEGPGSFKQTVSLDTAAMSSTTAPVPLTAKTSCTVGCSPAAVTARFVVSAASSSSTNYDVPAVTGLIPSVVFQVPSVWQDATLSMTPTVTTPSDITCADPTASSSPCSPDPVGWNSASKVRPYDPSAPPAASSSPVFTYTWTQASPATSPGGRIDSAMAYDAAHGKIVLFGGETSSGFLGDTWEYDGTTWTRRCTSCGPVARTGAVMTYDAARGQIVMFGGYASGNWLGDTWVWNGSSWTSKCTTCGPSGRTDASMAYDAARSQVVLFGGSPGLSDTWVWNGSTWASKSPASHPSARLEAAMAYDYVRSNVVLFGGAGCSATPCGDTWTWDGTNWSNKNPSVAPSARWAPSMTWVGPSSSIVVFGGVDSGGHAQNDLWSWNGSIWKNEIPDATSGQPQPRTSAMMAYDVGHQTAVLFGGQADDIPGTPLNDTWKLATSGENLNYHGGPVLHNQHVYVVFWGWEGLGTEESAYQAYIKNLFKGFGGNSYLGTTTQYYDSTGVRITNPTGIFVPSSDVWVDDSSIPVPASACTYVCTDPRDKPHNNETDFSNQLNQEVDQAISHFHATNQNAIYYVLTPSGSLDGEFDDFAKDGSTAASDPTRGYCGWHDQYSNGSYRVKVVNLPYQLDAPNGCRKNAVNSGTAGTFDGVSIVAAHEYVETLTDPVPRTQVKFLGFTFGDPGAWLDDLTDAQDNFKGHENADKCSPGAPHAVSAGYITLSGDATHYAVESNWDNRLMGGVGGCPSL